ncbi:hypothetical protein VNO77_15089 [Canavalia gladiata]|uniref:Uncharacterized protein n=1 Tax=Canavalia gladiata TaxID=3824 RepID=A0AAN9QR21_CANGL
MRDRAPCTQGSSVLETMKNRAPLVGVPASRVVVLALVLVPFDNPSNGFDRHLFLLIRRAPWPYGIHLIDLVDERASCEKKLKSWQTACTPHAIREGHPAECESQREDGSSGERPGPPTSTSLVRALGEPSELFPLTPAIKSPEYPN